MQQGCGLKGVRALDRAELKSFRPILYRVPPSPGHYQLRKHTRLRMVRPSDAAADAVNSA